MYNLGRASANIRILLPSFSFVESHLPPQGGLKTQGGLSKIKSLFTFLFGCGIINMSRVDKLACQRANADCSAVARRMRV